MFQNLKLFQSFLYRNFKNYEYCEKIYPVSDWTTKAHKLEHTQDMTRVNVKFQPIIDQTGTYTYNAAEEISNYLKPLCKNKYAVDDTQSFSQELLILSLLKEVKDYVSYDLKSLFTKIEFKRTSRLYLRSNSCAEKVRTNLHEANI